MIYQYAQVIWFILLCVHCVYAGDAQPLQTNESIKLVVSNSLRHLLQASKNPDVDKLLHNAVISEDKILAKINTVASKETLFRAVSFLRTSQQHYITDEGASLLSTNSLEGAMATIKENFDDESLFATIEKTVSSLVNTVAAEGKPDVSYQWLIKFSDEHIWTAKIKPINVNYLVFNRTAFLIKGKHIRNIIYFFDEKNGEP